jgi:peptide/nickel transport system ATP-binding protein
MTPIFEIDNLWVEAQAGKTGYKPIVKGINVDVNAGEVVAFIGESGSGKTTTALSALGYCKPGCRIVQGSIRLNGVDIL